MGMFDNDGSSSNVGNASLSSEQQDKAGQALVILFKALGAYIGWALVGGLPLYFGTQNIVLAIVGGVVGLTVSIVIKVLPFFKRHKALQTLLLWLPWIVVVIAAVIKIATK